MSLGTAVAIAMDDDMMKEVDLLDANDGIINTKERSFKVRHSKWS